MKKYFLKNKRLGFMSLLTAGLIAVLGAGVASLRRPQKLSTSAEIFHSAQGVTVQKNTTANAPGLVDDRKGIKLSASASGSIITVVEDMCGLFELDFRAYSSSAFTSIGTYYGENVANHALTLKTMSLIFTDTSDSSKNFRVGIDGACKQNFATPQAYVEAGGLRGGIYTHPEGFSSVEETNPNATVWDHSTPDMYGNTTGANANDRYTALWRTSFSNVAYTASQTWDGRETKLSAPDSNCIVFDPVSMAIYSKDAEGNETLIWDLSQEYNDGKKGVVFAPFESYNVALEFTEIVSNTTADVLIYSLNGQSLAGETHINDMGPSMFADFSKQAIKNVKYELPAPAYCDLLNNTMGATTVDVAVEGEVLTVYKANGKRTTTYSDGCYVIPKISGNMQITYKAKDSDGFDGFPLIGSVEVFDTQPKTNYTLFGRMEEGEMGVGTVLTIPAVSAINPANKKPLDVYVTVKKNGNIVNGLENRLAIDDYKITLDEVADYLITYRAEGVEDKLTYAITAVDTIPAFNLASSIVQEAYAGTNILIPSATAIFGNETKVATSKVRFPDGAIYTADTIFFNNGGKYVIEYSAEFSGKLYAKSYEIIVADKQATFIGGNSKDVVVNGASSARYDAITGLRIDSTGTNAFTYSQVLDLSQSTKDDLLIEIYNSAPWGEWDVGMLITLTDIYDPSNVITIKASSYWYYNSLWVKAAATGQTLAGWVDGALHDETSPYGTVADYSVNGHLGETRAWESYFADYKDLGLQFFYDNEEKTLYTKRGANQSKVVGFADSHQANPWTGFTTGEVYLSISGFKSIVVTEVYKNDLSGDKYLGGETNIFVDTQGYAETNLPNAVVGKAYTIFDAYAVNPMQGRVTDVSVAVYRNYGYPSFVEFEVIDGKFVPSLPGIYNIVYSWKDQFNNETVKVIRVTAIEEEEIVPVYVTVGTGASSMLVGEYYTLPKIENMGGGIADLMSSITVTDENGAEIEIKNNKFFAASAGEYTIVYRVYDFVGEGTPNEAVVSRSVYASLNNEPVLYDPILPEFMLSGMDLKLPAVSALDFSSGNGGVAPTSTSITVEIDGKVIAMNADNICRPEVAVGQTKDMTITYRAQGTQGSIEKSYTVKVVNPGTERGALWDYFQPVSGTFVKSTFATSGTLYQNLTLTSSDDNAAVQFINPVLAHDFGLSLSAMNSNTDKITITLYDSENMDISVRFDIIKNLANTDSSSGSFFSINGGVSVECGGSFYSESAILGFKYSQNTFKVTDNEGNFIGTVKETENGELFNGFPSNKVWVKIGYGDVTDSFEVRINKIGLQAISSRNLSSRATPAFYCTGFLPTQCVVGDVITIPVMVGQSAVMPRTSVTVRVLYLNAEGLEVGEFLGTSPINEPIQIKISNYSKYRIVYDVSDGFGRSVSVDYILSTMENEPPTLSVNGVIPKTAKVGDTIVLPEAIVVDNLCENPIARIFVISPDRDMKVLGEDRTFVATQAGQYVIRYYAYDDCFNYTVQNYVIMVE